MQPENQEVIKKLLEIKAHFDAQIQVATITITQPTFIIPSAEFNGKRSAELVKIWERARNKYEYALKINELSSKFGRVQNIVGELRSLYDLLPNSVYVRKHLAYANWLLGDRKRL